MTPRILFFFLYFCVGCTDKATTHFRSHTRAIWYDNCVWSRYRRGNCAPLGSVENGTDNPTSVKSKFHVGRRYCCITALLLACLVFPRYQKVVGTTFWSLPFICSCMTQLWTLRKDAERAPPSELMFCLANMWRFWTYSSWENRATNRYPPSFTPRETCCVVGDQKCDAVAVILNEVKSDIAPHSAGVCEICAHIGESKLK